MIANVPTTANLINAGAIQPCSSRATPTRIGRMNDVDRIGAAVEPVPQGRRLIHTGTGKEQPRGDKAPGDERFPEGIEDRGPREAAAEIRFARAVQFHGGENRQGHQRPGDDKPDDPGPRMFPVQLAQPVVTPCGDSQAEEKDVAAK